jgi:hypothetical protein
VVFSRADAFVDTVTEQISPAIPRPGGRDLSGEELREFVEALAARPELWRHLVRHESEQRTYERLMDDRHLTVWLNCWMDDHDTGFHDHDLSAGAVAVIEGNVVEERLRIDGGARAAVYPPGGIFDFAPWTIHRVRHGGGPPAVTLHAYSPPLWRMGSYAVGASGLLERRSLSYAEELRASPVS